MAIRLMAQVWRLPLKRHLKMPLLALADQANSDGVCWPNQTELAAMCSVSERQFRDAAAKLAADGWVTIHRRGNRRTNSYTLNVEKIATATGSPPPVTLEVVRESVTGSPPPAETPDTGGSPPPVEGAVRPEAHFRSDRKPTSGVTGSPPPVPHRDPLLTHERPVTDHLPPVGDLAAAETSSGRPRDFLWEALVAVHGQPAGDSERGKFNAVHKKLRDAEVDPAEYPQLVAAFVSKYQGNQPAVTTIAERVGELRHYLARGPMVAPDPAELDRQRRRQQIRESGHTNCPQTLPERTQ